MVYEVIKWVFNNPAAKSNFDTVKEVNDAIKQAIINDIRKNGYLFNWSNSTAPVLNTGELVKFDIDLCEELMCKAYNFNREQFVNYADKIPTVPDVILNETFECDFPLKKVIWIKKEVFPKFKETILNGNSNVEIIPSSNIILKKGDVVVFKSEDESDYFELNVLDFLPSEIYQASDLKYLEETSTQYIMNFSRNTRTEGTYKSEFPLLYRNENLTGEEIYNDFKNTYDIWYLNFFGDEFDCIVDFLVYDKNVSFDYPVYQMPEERKLSEEVLKKINDKYNAYLKEEETIKKQREEEYLKLKEKINKKKMQDNSIPFITMDNIGDYVNNEDYSIEDLIEKATKEYNLALNNNVIEKREMLLNNACIYFNKIIKKNGTIPPKLYLDVKLEQFNIYFGTMNTDQMEKTIKEVENYYSSLNDKQDAISIKYCNILLQYLYYLNDNNKFQELFDYANIILETLEENNSDDAFFIQANTFSILSSIYFEGKRYEQAIDFAYNALMLINEIQNKTPRIYDLYATFAFNLGNIYLQSDNYNNAATVLKMTVDFCKENEFKSKFSILNYASNYLAQTYVCKKEYENAINEYLDYIDYSKDNYSGDNANKIVLDFLYRIALIYHRFLNDDKTAKKYINSANEVINSLEDKNSDDVLDLIERINELLD